MSRITPTATTNGLAASTETAEATPGRAVCTIESNKVEAAERSYARASLGVGEELLTLPVAKLGFNQSLEVVCKASAAADGFAAKGEGKLSVSRRDDGKYEVEVFDSFGVGGGDERRKAMIGVAAGTKFVLNTPEAVADLVQAIGALGAVAVGTTSTFMPFVAVADAVTGTSRDALERLGHYRKNISEVKCDLRGMLEAGVGAHDPAAAWTGTKREAKVEGLAARELTIDLDAGSACLSTRFDGKGEIEGSLDLGPGGAIAKQFEGRFGGKAEAKVSFRLEERCVLPAELKARLARGELGPEEAAKALARLPITRVVVAEVEVETKAMTLINNSVRAKVTAEIPLEPGKSLDALLSGSLGGLAKPLLDAEWAFEGELGVLGFEGKLGTSFASVEASATQWTKGKRVAGSLRDCIEAAASQLEDANSIQASLTHQRLSAGLAS